PNQTASLAPGASATFNFPWTAPASAQSVTLTAIADVNNAVVPNEASESNNTVTRVVDVTAQAAPQLRVTALTVTPANPATPGNVTATATIDNRGSVASSATGITVTFSLDGVTVATASIGAVPANGASVVTVPQSIASGGA